MLECRFRLPSAPTHQHHSISDGQERAVAAFILRDLGIKVAHGTDAQLRRARIGNPTFAQHVVDSDEALRPDQSQRGFVVRVVVFLVGVDKDEIEFLPLA